MYRLLPTQQQADPNDTDLGLLLVVVDDSITSQAGEQLSLVITAAGGHHSVACQLGQLHGKLASAPSCCCDQHRLLAAHPTRLL